MNIGGLKMKSKTGNYLLGITIIASSLSLAQGCSQSLSPGASSTVSAPVTETQGVVTQVNTSEAPSVPSLENLIEKAKEDLAQRLDIPITQINLLEVTDVEWSDSSLGCPQPDMFYLQVITPGYRILLEVTGSQYEYHSNRIVSIVYCDNTSPPILPKP